MIGRWRRLTLTLAATVVLGGIVGAVGAVAAPGAGASPAVPAAQAQEAGEALHGTMTLEGEPMPGVAIRVETQDGAIVEEVVTDENGAWRVDLPSSGTYVVTLDQSTLPDEVALRDPERASTEIRVGAGAERQIVFQTGEGAEQEGELDRFLQRSLLGLKFGLLVGMMAVGLSLIFGTTGLINFAHGELVALGAVTTWVLNVWGGLHLFVAAPLGILLIAGFSGGLERFGFRRLRHRNIGGLQFLIVTIGLSLILQHVMLLVVGSEFRQYDQFARARSQQFGPFSISYRDVVLMVVSALILIAVALFLMKTRTGKALRAVSDNPALAASSGINVDRVTAVVWVLGGGLAATGGVFLGLFNNVQYLMGFQFLLLMFAAVILGGLGAPFGAMFGGLVVGYISEVSTLWLRTELKNVWALVVLILVLLIRPQGLFGRRERVG